MKKTLIIIIIGTLMLLFPVESKGNRTTKIKEARIYLNLEQIRNALDCYSQAVTYSIEHREAGSGVDGELLAEYSYALALHHDFDAAIMYLDRARAMNANYKDFYSAQLMRLLGYDDAANQFMNNTDDVQSLLTQKDVPNWINGIYQRLTPKYATHISIIRESPQDALERAGRLVSSGQTIQSMVIFEELLSQYPETFIIPINYSQIWETLGRLDHAVMLLQKGIDMMPQDTTLDRSKNVLVEHLVQLKKSAQVDSKSLKVSSLPRLMVYVGASAAKEQFSLNGRIGMYTTNKFSASLNIGLGWLQDTKTGNLGLSAYKSWKFFVFGLGVSDQFSQETHTFGLSPSIGLSFMNKAQTSSFDITLGSIIPFSQEQKFSWNISIGTTIYTDVKGGRK